MILDSTLKVLRVVLGENHTTTQCDCVTSWAEEATPNVFNPGNTNIHTNDTTPVIVVAAPTVAGRCRDVREVRVNNSDTVTHTITLQLYDGTTAWPIAPSKVSVPAGGAFVYTPQAGISVVTSTTAATGIVVVDGNGTTVTGVTSLTLAGPTVTGSTPNATATLVPRGYIDGCITSIASTTTFTVAAGQTTSSDNTTVMNLASALTKSSAGTWVAGNNQNGLDTGTIASSTWYHVFVIFNPTTLVTDVLFSTSPSSPSLPSGFTKSRRVRSLLTDGSAHFLGDTQAGDRIDWLVPVTSITGVVGNTTGHLGALQTPLGVVTEGILSGEILDSAAGILYISNPAQTDVAPSGSALIAIGPSASASTNGGYGARVVTDTSSNIRYRVSTTTATIIINTNGYIDRRGKS